jgi:hypothetical protein
MYKGSLYFLMNIKPLKQIAKSIGGLIYDILKEELDEIAYDDYVAKCGTWLLVLQQQKRKETKK